MAQLPRKTAPYPFNSANELLDGTNLRLLEELQRDPRATMSALGRRIGLSPPSVSERVRRLEGAGVIAGYRLDVDHRAVGLPVTAFVRIRPGPGRLEKVAELARQTPEVVECYRITGEDCFLMKLHVTEMDALEAILDRFLLYGQTSTSLVQSSPVPPRPLPLPREE